MSDQASAIDGIEHLVTFGTWFGGSHIELGCCQSCGAVVMLSGHGSESNLTITLTAEDHLAWHERAGV